MDVSIMSSSAESVLRPSRLARSLRRAREQMVVVREEILRAAAGRSEEELLRVPAGGGWCAAEVLDHIRTAESSLVRALGKLERGEPTRVPAPAWYYRLPMSPIFWNVRFRAP